MSREQREKHRERKRWQLIWDQVELTLDGRADSGTSAAKFNEFEYDRQFRRSQRLEVAHE